MSIKTVLRKYVNEDGTTVSRTPLVQLVEKGYATIIIADVNSGITISGNGKKNPMTAQPTGYQFYDNLVGYLGLVELHSIKICDDTNKKGAAANAYIKGNLENSFYQFAWVKNDKVVFVHADSLIEPITNAAKLHMQANGSTKLEAWNAVKETVFQEAIEIEATLTKGGHKAGKRLSGDEGTPWLAGHTYRSDTVRILWADWLDTDGAEDGGGIIMSKFADNIINQVNVNAPDWKAADHKARLEHAGSFEARMRIPASVSEDAFGTKWKGDLIRRSVVEGPNGKIYTSKDADLILPSGSAKTEVKYTGESFWIGLRPRHWKNTCWLDIQSTIDLHQIIPNEYILSEVKAYATEYLVKLRNGEITPDPLDNIHTEEQFDKLSNWVQGEYFASGGKTMWFAGMVRRVANAFLLHLTNTVSEKFSLPVKGGRFYMCSDRLHGKKVEVGQIYLDVKSSRAVISHEQIVEVFAVMGGGDSDDSLQLPMYIDSITGKVMVIAHRQPNQYGERILFELAEGSWQAENLPTWDSALAPTRIDKQGRDFLTLKPDEEDAKLDVPNEYSLPNLLPYINRSIGNVGILGSCVLAMEEEVSNELTPTFPYPMEEIVDGPVQWGWNAQPAKEAEERLNEELMDTYTSMYFAKRKAYPKLSALVRLNRISREAAYAIMEEGREAVTAVVLEHSRIQADHWLDNLMAGVRDIAEMFKNTIPMVASLASPPLAMYLAGAKYTEEGSNLRRQFGRIINNHKVDGENIPEESWDVIIEEMDAFMDQYDTETQRKMLLGAARNAYTDSGNSEGYASDGVLFIGNNGTKFIEALRTVPMGNGTMLKRLTWQNGAVVSEEGMTVDTAEVEEAHTLPIAMTMAWYKVGVSAGELPDNPSNVTKAQRVDWHKRIEASAHRLVGQMATVVMVEDRSEIVLANGTCIGNVAPKRRPMFPAGTSFTIGDISANGGNFYAVAVM